MKSLVGDRLKSSGRFFSSCFLAVLAVFALAAPALSQSLFQSLPVAGARATATAQTPLLAVRQSREVTLDAAYAAEHIAPFGVDSSPDRINRAPDQGELRIELFPGTVVQVSRTALKEAFGGGYVWIGRTQGANAATVHLVFRGGQITGTVTAGGLAGLGAKQYRIDPLAQPGLHRISEMNASAFPDGKEIRVSGVPTDTPPVGPNAISTIDVLVSWASATVPSGTDMVAQSNLAVARANTSYQDSNVEIELRLVGTQAVAGYNDVTAANYDAVLSAVSSNSGSFTAVHTARATTGADLVAFFTQRTEYCGLAWAPEFPGPATADNSAFAVVTLGCITNESFTHELGHNMGLFHDRYVESPTPPNSKYNFGYVDLTGRVRTIMAYNNLCAATAPGTSCTRLGIFSSPNILRNGRPMGIAQNSPGAADNSRRLGETRAAIAAYRSGSTPPPPQGNDNFADRTTITPATTTGGTVSVSGNNSGYSRETGEPEHWTNSPGYSSAWWRFTPTSSGNVTISTAGSSFDTILAVYTGSSVSALASVAKNDDVNSTAQSSVTFSATAGTQYQIAVSGYGTSDVGSVSLSITGGGGTAPPPTASLSARLNWYSVAARNGVLVSVLGSMTNTGSTTASNCYITKPSTASSVTLHFAARNSNGTYQPTNSRFSIAPGATQQFVILVSSSTTFNNEIAINYACNSTLAPSIRGLNTLLITTMPSTPSNPVMSATTPTNDNILNVPQGGNAAVYFNVQNAATTNALQARVSTLGVLGTGTVIPVTVNVCMVNLANACLTTASTAINFGLYTNTFARFKVTVTSNGTAIALNNAHRVYLHIYQGGVPVGSHNVQVRTTSPDADTTASLDQAALLE